jgi:hypothetical protein
VGDDIPSRRALRSECVINSGGKRKLHMCPETVYRIVIRDELSERYALAFEGMEMETKDGQTVLTGKVIDQPHLHGLLDRIGAMGLTLVSVESVPSEHMGDK